MLTSLPLLEDIGAVLAAETVRLPPNLLNHSSPAWHERMAHWIFDHLIVIHRSPTTIYIFTLEPLNSPSQQEIQYGEKRGNEKKSIHGSLSVRATPSYGRA